MFTKICKFITKRGLQGPVTINLPEGYFIMNPISVERINFLHSRVKVIDECLSLSHASLSKDPLNMGQILIQRVISDLNTERVKIQLELAALRNMVVLLNE